MRPTEPSPWAIDLKYKTKLGLEDSKFIFEQAEKAFLDTIETSKKILDRSSTLLTLVSGLLVALVTYCIKTWVPGHGFSAILITAMAAIVYYFMVGFFIFPDFKPTEYNLPGTQPKKYFVDQLFDLKPPAEGRVVFLYIIEIKNLQQAITENHSVNNKRWRYYTISLNLLFGSPAFIIVVYAVVSLIKK